MTRLTDAEREFQGKVWAAALDVPFFCGDQERDTLIWTRCIYMDPFNVWWNLKAHPDSYNRALDLRTYEGMGYLLEAMRLAGWRYRIYGLELLSCEFWNQTDPRVEAEADTLPEAVLRAAAKALQVKEPGTTGICGVNSNV